MGASHHLADVKRLNGDNPSISDRNLAVTPKFRRLECTQQASVITWVSFTTFGRGYSTAKPADYTLAFATHHFLSASCDAAITSSFNQEQGQEFYSWGL